MNHSYQPTALGAITEKQMGPQESCAQRQPEVHAAVARLDRLLDDLSATTNALSDRLAPVMRQEPSDGIGTCNAIHPISTPLAGRIDALCDALDASLTKIDRVMQRLEI